MKKLVGTIILATALGAPAFAQSFDPDSGTGNLITRNFIAVPRAPVTAWTAPRHPGENAYALYPRRTVKPNAGHWNTEYGSTGYNEMLRNW
jgi:hypothetical protein